MNLERKRTAKRIISLFAAASILATMAPGIAASANDTVITGADMPNAILHSDEGESDDPTGTAESTRESGMSTEEGSGSIEPDTPTSSENGTDEADLHSANNVGFNLYSNAQENVGDFTVIGGTEADGDFTYDSNNRSLTITSNKTLTIKNIDPTTPTDDRIIIKSNISANIVLDGVNLNNSNYAGISVGTTSIKSYATIILADKSQNIIESYGAAIEANYRQAEITITCEHADEEGHQCDSSTCGSLKATSKYGSGAGIGSTALSSNSTTGSITIKGGNIEASSNSGAGIGSASGVPLANNISISGGNIKATGGNAGAGIGGSYNSPINGNIIITGGKIAAFGSCSGGNTQSGAGIGSGYGGCLYGSINISGGEIYAKAGDCGDGAVGIGAAPNTGDSSNVGKISISDGCVYAIGSESSAAIGYSAGVNADCDIDISGGIVKTERGTNAASDMSSAPHNGGSELDIINIDNTDGKSITINGKSYPSAFTYNDGTADHTEKTFFIYAPINRRAEVVLGSNAPISYYYTNNDKFEKIDEIQYDVYPTNNGDTLKYGTDFTYDPANFTLTIKTDTPVTIKNIDPNYHCGPIKIENGYDADITLAGVKNRTYTGQGSGIVVDEDNTNNIKITLADGTENKCLVASDDCPAIRCSSDTRGNLTITCQHSEEPGHICNSNCGSLIASNTDSNNAAYSAAIGSGKDKDLGNITINGGNITALSTYGAAIGCGNGGLLLGIITINGGIINANSSQGNNNCAIGSSSYDRDPGGSIIINGGMVIAECGSNGYDVNGGPLIINDGSIVLLKEDNFNHKEPFNSDVFSLKNSDGDDVHLLTIKNEEGKEVEVNGKNCHTRTSATATKTFTFTLQKAL